MIKMLTALQEDLSLVPNTQGWQLTITCNSSIRGGLTPSFGHAGHLYECDTQTDKRACAPTHKLFQK